MRDALRAGIALYNDGEYHAAHDPWEDRWLELEAGTEDERLLHGLIQFTAAIYHARNRNWPGAIGLAESALDYLRGLPKDYLEIDLDPIRAYLSNLASDPEVIERRGPPRLTHEGDSVRPDDLSFDAAAIAAVAIAEEYEFDERVLSEGIEYALNDLAEGWETSPFVTLVLDFVRDREHRAIVYQRLRKHAERRASRERDAEGLFD